MTEQIPDRVEFDGTVWTIVGVNAPGSDARLIQNADWSDRIADVRERMDARDEIRFGGNPPAVPPEPDPVIQPWLESDGLRYPGD